MEASFTNPNAVNNRNAKIRREALTTYLPSSLPGSLDTPRNPSRRPCILYLEKMGAFPKKEPARRRPQKGLLGIVKNRPRTWNRQSNHCFLQASMRSEGILGRSWTLKRIASTRNETKTLLVPRHRSKIVRLSMEKSGSRLHHSQAPEAKTKTYTSDTGIHRIIQLPASSDCATRIRAGYDLTKVCLRESS